MQTEIFEPYGINQERIGTTSQQVMQREFPSPHYLKFQKGGQQYLNFLYYFVKLTVEGVLILLHFLI